MDIEDSAARDADRGSDPGQPQEKVEDRPNVSTVTPDDYPKGKPDGGKPDDDGSFGKR